MNLATYNTFFIKIYLEEIYHLLLSKIFFLKLIKKILNQHGRSKRFYTKGRSNENVSSRRRHEKMQGVNVSCVQKIKRERKRIINVKNVM